MPSPQKLCARRRSLASKGCGQSSGSLEVQILRGSQDHVGGSCFSKPLFCSGHFEHALTIVDRVLQSSLHSKLSNQCVRGCVCLKGRQRGRRHFLVHPFHTSPPACFSRRAISGTALQTSSPHGSISRGILATAPTVVRALEGALAGKDSSCQGTRDLVVVLWGLCGVLAIFCGQLVAQIHRHAFLVFRDVADRCRGSHILWSEGR